MDVVVAGRALTESIWLGELPRDVWEAGGLNAEDVVRVRLDGLRGELLEEGGLRGLARTRIERLEPTCDANVDVLAGWESALRCQHPCQDVSPHGLLESAGRATFLLLRGQVLQGLAGRLGVWAVSEDAVAPARTARRLRRGLPPPDFRAVRSRLMAARLAKRQGRLHDVVRFDLDADRLVRTAAGLARVAEALLGLDDLEGARWAVRACLLEPAHRFEGRDAHAAMLALDNRLDPSRRPPTRRPSMPIEAVLLTPPAGHRRPAAGPADLGPRAPTPVVFEPSPRLEPPSAVCLRIDAPPRAPKPLPPEAPWRDMPRLTVPVPASSPARTSARDVRVTAESRPLWAWLSGEASVTTRLLLDDLVDEEIDAALQEILLHLDAPERGVCAVEPSEDTLVETRVPAHAAAATLEVVSAEILRVRAVDVLAAAAVLSPDEQVATERADPAGLARASRARRRVFGRRPHASRQHEETLQVRARRAPLLPADPHG